MRQLTLVTICTCLVFLFGAGNLISAAEKDPPVKGFKFFYTKTCDETQICSCDSPNDVVVTGGAVCSQGENAILLVYLTSSGPTCVLPVESGGFIGCLDPTHVPNAWYAECGQCTFSLNGGPSCSNNLFPASITITCFRG
jgi:hypothetical protein